MNPESDASARAVLAEIARQNHYERDCELLDLLLLAYGVDASTE